MKNKSWIVTRNKEFFENIGNYNYCSLEDMILPDRIAYDSETTGLNARQDEVFAIQLGTGKNNYLIDLQQYPEFEGEFLRIRLEEVIPYFIDKELVGQNITFDLKFLNFKGFYPKRVRDTFITSKILYNGNPPNFLHGFKHIMQRELNVIYDKTDQKNIHLVKLSQPSTIEYSFNDVDRLLECHDILVKKLTNWGAIQSYDLHCKFIRVLAYMELCGLPLDEKAWSNKIKTDTLKSKEKAKEIIEYIYEKLPKYRDNQLSLFDTEKNIKVLLSSAKQMIPVFNDLGIKTEVDDKGKISNSIEEAVIKKTKHEFVNLWLEYRKAEHRVTTHGQNILDKVIEGRIYTAFNPLVDTARLSTRAKEVNFLNFPSDKETRNCFKSKKGFRIVVCDYAAQEGVICADLSEDEMMLDSVINDKDLHAAFARQLFPELAELSDDEIAKKHKIKRTYVKAPRFALQYGAGSYTLASNMNISLEEAQKIEKAFKELHKGIFEWGDREFISVLKNGYIESALGFKLILPQWKHFQDLDAKFRTKDKAFWSTYRIGKEDYKNYWEIEEKRKKDKTIKKYKVKNEEYFNIYKENKSFISDYFSLKGQYYRLTLNNPIQATGAHQLKYSLILLFKLIEENNHYNQVKICVTPHDEIFMEVEKDLAEFYAEKLSECMVTGGNYFLKSGLVSMKADANIGDSWYSAK